MFENMGFTYVPTEGKEAKFGLKTGELDALFVYENIFLIVEDTTNKKAFDHAKNKSILAQQIFATKRAFVDWLRDNFPKQRDLFSAYSHSRVQLFYLYVPKYEMDLDEDQRALLGPMKVVSSQAQMYFIQLSRTIYRSARTDLWRFLGLASADVGNVDASSDSKTIETTIISPEDSTGFANGVRLVSFMISADVLLRNSYVLRKDNWGYSTRLYQRVIDKPRLAKIRRYVASEGSAFLNNIIVGLPAGVSFQNAEGSSIDLESAQDYSSYRMTLPNEFNSLCIIDGQHRVFAHYEGKDDLEPKIAKMRGKVHLLATGLIFPNAMSELERLQVQSEIFLDINTNTQSVQADVLLSITALREPYTDVAIARRVLEVMNSKPAFRGMFQLSQMTKAPVKIASIIKFALRYLVDIDSDEGLFGEWSKGQKGWRAVRDRGDENLLGEYVDFCASVLDRYFKALKSCYESEWRSPDSKISSITVVNAMIIALRRSIPEVGILSFGEYQEMMRNWEVDFSKENFPYVSSQYARFSVEILRDAFQLVETDGRWVRAQE